MSSLLPSSEYTVRDQERMTAAVRYFQWQVDLVRPWLGNRVLEVGCGIGNFTRCITDRELVVCVDVDRDCVERHRKAFREVRSVRTVWGSASGQELLSLRKQELQSVVMLNVLEHIEDDLGTLQNLSQLLPPQGRVIVMVPAFPALYGPIDRLLGHYRRYTKDSLSRLSRAAGFTTTRLHYMNSVGFFGWWANARGLKRTEQSARQIRTFDGWVVPWLRRLEHAVPPPFGQSLFAVLEKRER